MGLNIGGFFDKVGDFIRGLEVQLTGNAPSTQRMFEQDPAMSRIFQGIGWDGDELVLTYGTRRVADRLATHAPGSEVQVSYEPMFHAMSTSGASIWSGRDPVADAMQADPVLGKYVMGVGHGAAGEITVYMNKDLIQADAEEKAAPVAVRFANEDDYVPHV